MVITNKIKLSIASYCLKDKASTFDLHIYHVLNFQVTKAKPSANPGCAIILLIALVFTLYAQFFAKKDPGASEVVHNSEVDASVSQVEIYLKNNLSDPDSYQEISWSVVVKLNDSKEQGYPKYQVRHKYRAKNEFGGYVVEEKVFRLDYLGNVVDSRDFSH